MKIPPKRNELPPPRPILSSNSGFSRNAYPPKPPHYNSSSTAPTNMDFETDHFHFNSDSMDRSMNHSGRPRNRRYDYPSQISSSTMPSSGTNSRMPSSYPRITSTGTGLTSSEDMTNYRGRRPPPYAASHIYPNQSSEALHQQHPPSDHSSVYSTSSYDSQEDYQSRFPPRPPKPSKYLQGQVSSSTGTTLPTTTGEYFPHPSESLPRFQSGFTDTTDTTLGDSSRPPNLEELADYFNKKLDAIKKQTDTVVDDIIKGKKSSKVGIRSGLGIRPTNRAAETDGSMTPTNTRLTSTQSLATGLTAVRDQIENLKNQIKKGLDHFGDNSQTSSRDMEKMANFFSKRLEDCQKQVTEAVSKVQSQVGDLKKGYETRKPQRGYTVPTDNSVVKPSNELYYDSSDSGIGPKGLTVRPQTRARSDLKAGESNTTEQTFPNNSSIMSGPPPIRRRQTKPDESFSYPPPVPPPNLFESERSDVTVVPQAPVPPPPMTVKPDVKLLPAAVNGDEDYLMLGSDAEDNWDDFEEFIDDDTPAPETSIPVPEIKYKDHNYFYQTLYILYICSFLAYVYVRINYTLDSVGLNRVYCIVVAILEIITAPSLIMQGMCLWRWVSREPPPPDAYLRIRFHTARIMVPTYKEPLEVVAGTIHEIVHMDLPPNFHIHVYVLDDGKREVLENWVLSKRTKRRVFLHYVARPKLPGVPHHAKAGNINHTLHYVFDDAYAEKECVIIFDADFMPRRNYLLQVLPVFSEKRTRPLGLVQTPQFFYNVNPDEDVWDHLNVSFFHRIEPSLDRWSAVNCCGTNFVVRADALKDVGYFPVGCLTEDTLLSLRLCTMGWGVAYHHEVLAIGQSPHEVTEIFKQRSRWCKGNLQIFLDEFPLMQSGLSLTQRIFYSSCGFNYFCASLSIPFFQLVPAWAIFFGLWPVSEIGLEFAFAFFIYYMLGNMLLLFPPPGFGVKDMWNGELASTNLWFTYFNGVRRIVGTKILKGKGELTFKTTKKKTDDDDDASNVGFQKEDLKACFMHFIFFFIMLITILYAIIRAITATDVKFYFYYMYMIGMSWALINMTPYLIVVIYCWYRVRIPGLMVACFRNVQLLLRVVCAALILVQAYTTRNLTENFSCPHVYTGELGRSPLAMVKTPDIKSGLEVSRNSFWVLGLKDDFYTIQQVKQTACLEDEVPIVVVFMHPSSGLQLDPEAGHYMPDERIESWEEYDERMQELAEHLSEVPSLIVLEPSLLMHTYNSGANYHNSDYQIAFAQRVEMTTRLFPKSWVYVDAGNAMYLQWGVNLEHIIDVFQTMPKTIRGFSINVGSFVNVSFNEHLADEIFCSTGFHYIIDTSRNGGSLSDQDLAEINKCTYDPPNVQNGTVPMWQKGAKIKEIKVKSTGEINTLIETDTETEYEYEERRKRWAFEEETDAGGPIFEADNPAAGGALPDYDDGGETYMDEYKSNYGYDDGLSNPICQNDGEPGLDAYAWVKTPGESDGRLFPSGEYHPCLEGHDKDCSDVCPQYVPKIAGEFQRTKACECVDPET